MVDFLKKKWNKLSIIPTKKKLRANARSFFSLWWLKELVLELLDTGFLAAEAAQIVDA